MTRIGIAFVALFGATSLTACFSPSSTTCGDEGPTCPPGWACTADNKHCINLEVTSCGDGVVDDGEQCDDGNLDNHDGCNFDCTLPRCGDGLLDAGEVCDDANAINGDGCSANCLSLEVCGDDIVTTVEHPARDAQGNIIDGEFLPAEECDSGGEDTADCNADCTFRRCGDGIVNAVAGEECDALNPDLNTSSPNREQGINTLDCTSECLFSSCGDDFTNPAASEQCDLGRFCVDGTTACTSSADCVGQVGGNECSTTNVTSTSGAVCCTQNCQNPLCGNNVLEFECETEAGVASPLENCDDGRHCADLTPCTTNAQCANVAGEDKECRTRRGTGCREDCLSNEVCGDGILNNYPGLTAAGDPRPAEVCDDGRRCQDGTPCNTERGFADPSICAGIGDGLCIPRRGFGCTADCQSAEVCGDGVENDYPGVTTAGDPRPAEVCDDGRHCEDGTPCVLGAGTCLGIGDGFCLPRNADGCSDDCLSEEVCGDGITNDYDHEIFTTNEVCAPFNDQTCPLLFQPVAGVGHRLVTREVCDDGRHCENPAFALGNPNRFTECDDDDDCLGIGDGQCLPRDGTGCSSDCLSTEVCGDGYVSPTEVCDDGNTADDDGCSSNCRSQEQCGNGIRDVGEECDYGPSNGTGVAPAVGSPEAEGLVPPIVGGEPACSSQCRFVACGNARVDQSEVCDESIVDPDEPGANELEGPFLAFNFDNARCNSSCGCNTCGDSLVNVVPNAVPLTCVDNSDCVFDAGLTCQVWPLDIAENPDQNKFCGLASPTLSPTGRELFGATTIACEEDADCAMPVGLQCNASNECTFPTGWLANCPNSYREDCDESGVDTATCDRDCSFPICGDGYTNFLAGEECDNGPGDVDGQTAESDDCDVDCRRPSCGDLKVNTTRGEVCDDGRQCVNGADCLSSQDCADLGLANVTCLPRNGDGCSADCVSEEFCGDGIVNPYEVEVLNEGGQVVRTAPTEVCDDGRHCEDPGVAFGDPGRFTRCTDDAQCAGIGDGLCLTRDGTDCSSDCLSVEVCGDSYLNFNETCDDGDADSFDGCSDDCLVEDGWLCPEELGQPCAEVCGDGLVVGRETCDDGRHCADGTACDDDTPCGDASACIPRANDGCSATCVAEIGWTCPGVLVAGDTNDTAQPGGDCTANCGDFLIRGPETCDDGNTAPGDGCSGTCQEEAGWTCAGVNGGLGGLCSPDCGDGEVRGLEECDDGNTNNLDGCDDRCRVELGWVCPTADEDCDAVCGDFIIRGDEQCDDGNTDPGDGCDENCAFEPGWSCPDVGFEVTVGGDCVAVCGDEILRADEACDDGKHCADGTSCDDNSECTGIGDEICRARSGDGCDSGCQIELGWDCPFDAGTGVGGTCGPACGDGLVRGEEQCDEGGFGTPIGGDPANGVTGGCDQCQVVTGWYCPSAFSTGGLCTTQCGDGIHVTNATEPAFAAQNEECDEGGANSDNAGCTSTCTVATCADGLQRTIGAASLLETGVDCGGVCLDETPAQRCGAGVGCEDNADCDTNYCDFDGGGLVKVCQNPPLEPVTLNVLEGDILAIDVVADLFGGNTTIDLETFRIVDDADDSACGGDLLYDPVSDDTQVLFDAIAAGGADGGAEGCTVNGVYTDSFAFEVCPNVGACFESSATIVINRAPVVADSFLCRPLFSDDATLDVASVTTEADDADGFGTINATGADGTAFSGATVVWEPSDDTVARTYSVSVEVCDDSVTPGCDTGTWSLVWNDAPTLAGRTGAARIPIVVGESDAVPIEGGVDPIVVDTGAVVGVQAGDPISSVAVGAFSNGPFSATSQATVRGTCAVNGNNVEYTAGTEAGNDSCFVRVCEACSGDEVCAVAEVQFKLIGPPTANDDIVFAIEGDPAGTQAAGTFSVVNLTSNDTDFDPTSFSITGTTACLGTVALNGPQTQITYTGPNGLSPVDPCVTDDSFTYEVCSVDIPTRCDTATVDIEINRRPVVDDRFTCVPVGTTRTTTNATTLYTDPDADPIGAVTPSGTGGLATVAANVVTWAPDDRDDPRVYYVTINMCDDASVVGCADGTWTTVWNDPPQLQPILPEAALPVFANEDVTTEFDDFLLGLGVVKGIAPGVLESPEPNPTIDSVSITTPAPTIGTCAVDLVNEEVRYEAGATTGSDTCWVEVCEICDGGDVCAVTQINVEVFDAPVATNDVVTVLEGNNGTFAVSALVANDTDVTEATFAIVGGATTTCGGSVSLSGGNVNYVPPGDPSACGYVDSFSYDVASAHIPSRRSNAATVQIVINRPPTVADAFTCVPVNTASHSLDVDDPAVFSDTNTDPRPGEANDLLDADSIGTSGPGTGGASRVGSVVTWTPNNTALGASYAITVSASDNAPAPATGTDSGTWTALWNDPPTLADLASTPTAVALSGSETFNFTTIALDTGAVREVVSTDVLDALASVEVSANVGGPWAATATTARGGCEVDAGNELVRYNAGATEGADSCFVRVCELCGATPVCDVVEIALDLVETVNAADDSLSVIEVAQSAIPVTFFTGNDSAFDATSFTLGALGGGCTGGAVALDGAEENVLYTPPADPTTCTTPWEQTFSYQVCNPSIPTDCDTATVTVTINQAPSLDLSTAFACVPVTTDDVSVDVAGFYSDPDDALDAISVVDATSADAGVASVSLTTVTWTPTDDTIVGRYAIAVTATDDAPQAPVDARGSDTDTWNVVWNDAPALLTPSASDHVIGGAARTLVLADYFDDEGDENGLAAAPAGPADVIDTVLVSTVDNDPLTWAASADLGIGTCAVNPTTLEITFTPSASTTGSATCHIQVCEVCSGGDVCALTSVTFTVVECEGDVDCGGNPNGTECDLGTNTCGCTDAGDCPVSGACGGSGVCVACVDDDLNAGAQDTGCNDPNLPMCDTSGTPVCVGCLASTDCTGHGDGPLCNTTTNLCVECLSSSPDCDANPNGTVCTDDACGCGSDTDCLGSDVCDPTPGTCDVCYVDVGETVDPGCDSATPACDDSDPVRVCVECTDNGDCAGHANGEVCDTANNVCVACLDDNDCGTSMDGDRCDLVTNTCGCDDGNDCMQPGVRGPLCGGAGICASAYTINYCELQWPDESNPIALEVGGTFTTFGRVLITGLTDTTENAGDADPYGLVIGVIGQGPTASDPSADLTGWTFSADSALNAGAGGTGDNDEYQSELTAAGPAGTYDLAFRFSGDGGLTWSYCDAGGVSFDLAESYNPTESGVLNVCAADEYADSGACVACVAIANCVAGQLSCTTGADQACAQCEVGFSYNAGTQTCDAD